MYINALGFQYFFNPLLNRRALVAGFAQNIDHNGVIKAGGIAQRLVKYGP